MLAALGPGTCRPLRQKRSLLAGCMKATDNSDPLTDEARAATDRTLAGHSDSAHGGPLARASAAARFRPEVLGRTDRWCGQLLQHLVVRLGHAKRFFGQVVGFEVHSKLLDTLGNGRDVALLILRQNPQQIIE